MLSPERGRKGSTSHGQLSSTQIEAERYYIIVGRRPTNTFPPYSGSCQGQPLDVLGTCARFHNIIVYHIIAFFMTLRHGGWSPECVKVGE